MDINEMIAKANQNTLTEEEKKSVSGQIMKELSELSSTDPEKYHELLKVVNESLKNINSTLRRV
jgi:HSP90 family molecular chaperone